MIFLILPQLGTHPLQIVLEAGEVVIAAVYLVFEGVALGEVDVVDAVVEGAVGVDFGVFVGEGRGGEFEEGGGGCADGAGRGLTGFGRCLGSEATEEGSFLCLWRGCCRC